MDIEEDVQYASEAETVPNAPEVCEETKTDSISTSMQEDPPENSLQNKMLDHIAGNKVAHFKSQQVGDPELTFEQKRKIAEDILIRNPGQFLSRFGHFLQINHLDYFTDLENKSENYEVSFHVKRLQRFHCKSKNEVDVKNRRFEALKKLVKEGSYFSEKQMKQRNPLLYQQLIGQYLTKKEVEDRKNADMTEITSWLSLVLAQIERDQMLCLQKQQEDDEDGAVEEVDTSDEEQDDTDDDDDEENGDSSDDSGIKDNKTEHEGDFCVEDEDREENENCLSAKKKRKLLPGKERDLLREEFVSNMYRSFLEGKDQDFDYSQVDLNPEYDCLAVRSQDEEEKYFDSETPELVADEAMSDQEDDELDVYMKNLKPEITPSDLAGNFNILL